MSSGPIIRIKDFFARRRYHFYDLGAVRFVYRYVI
jgi:hypothetical protein